MTDFQKDADEAGGRLADYLQANKDLLITDWLKEVRADPVVLSAALTEAELVDHVPQIFDAIVEAVRSQSSQTTGDVQDLTARHTIIRWVQRYDLRALLREVALLRAALIRQLLAFDAHTGDLGSDARLSNTMTIHRILDDIIIDGTDTFLKLKSRGDEN